MTGGAGLAGGAGVAGLRQAVVDGFGAGVAEGGIEEAALGQLEAVGDQEGVDGVVAGIVPAVDVAAAAAEMVGEGDVVALVRDQGDSHLVGELGEPSRIDGELDAVGPGGVGRRVLDPFEAQGEGGEEGMAQDEAGKDALQEIGL